MKNPLIQSTKNYSLFVRHENQQPLSSAHIGRLAESMLKRGFLPAKAVHVYRKAGKLHLIDGHHRVAAAEAAGVFVHYIVDVEANADFIGEGNDLVRKWKTLSFVKLYADRGNSNYATILHYVDLGFPIGSVISLLEHFQ